MKILVCVKQVPDSESMIRINDNNNWIQFGQDVAFKMNRFDEFALEEALRIRESIHDATIDAISIGPERSASTIKKALEMGADNGIHIVLKNEQYIPPFIIASWIASYAADKDYDLFLTGVMAEDDMQCQAGQSLAGILDIPCASSVITEKILPDRKTIYVEREIEGGLRESVELTIPALLTIQSGINRPRYPSLSNVLRAKKQKIIAIAPESLPEPEERDRLLRISYPEKSAKGIFINGSTEEKAAKLMDILHKESLI